jgi:hypothetical protein
VRHSFASTFLQTLTDGFTASYPNSNTFTGSWLSTIHLELFQRSLYKTGAVQLACRIRVRRQSTARIQYGPKTGSK